MSDPRDMTAYWGECDEGHSVVVFPTVGSAEDLPDMWEDEDEWESGGIMAECYVCGGDIMWGGSDPAVSIIKNYW